MSGQAWSTKAVGTLNKAGGQGGNHVTQAFRKAISTTIDLDSLLVVSQSVDNVLTLEDS